MKKLRLLILLVLAPISYFVGSAVFRNASSIKPSSTFLKITWGKRGERYTWNFQFRSEGSQDFGILLSPTQRKSGQNPQEEKYQSDIRGQVSANILSMDSRETVIAYTFDGLTASVTVPGGSIESISDELASTNDRPILATYNANGEIVSVKADRKGIASQLAANVIYRLQLPLQEIRHKIPYTIREIDENGSSNIQVEANVEEGTLRKSKQRYFANIDSLFSINADTKVYAKIADDTMYSMSGEQNLQFIGNQKSFSRAVNTWTFERISKSVVSNSQIERLSQIVRAYTFSMILDSNSDEQRQLRLVRESKLEDLIDVIYDPAFGTSANRVGKTVAQLVAHLRKDPRAISKIQEVVETAALDSPAFVYGLGAMVQAGTPEIQTHLIDILRSGLGGDSKRLFRVVSQLHDMKHPTIELSDAVLDLSKGNDDFIARAATLAVGSIVGHLEPSQKKNEIIAGLVERWNRAKVVDEKVLVLRSLGNSGVSDVISIASMGLAPNESYITRKAAAEALRWNKDPASQELLLESYVKDPNIEVKRSVLHAFQYQELSETILLRLVQDLVKREGDESLKILVMNTVWQYRNQDQLITQAVASLSSRRSDLGREAKRLLNQI